MPACRPPASCRRAQTKLPVHWSPPLSPLSVRWPPPPHRLATLQAQLKLVIDSIVWAFRHTERNIADTGAGPAGAGLGWLGM